MIGGSGERTHDLSADINIRLWQTPTTNIDDSNQDEDEVEDDEDEDLMNEDLDHITPSSLHDQRLEEDSVAASDEELDQKPMMAGKPPASGVGSGISYPQRTEVVDMLPDRPRKSQPIAHDEPRQRRPAARTVPRRPNGMHDLTFIYLFTVYLLYSLYTRVIIHCNIERLQMWEQG